MRRAACGTVVIPVPLRARWDRWRMRFRPRLRTLQQLRDRWGRPAANDRPFASRYFELVRKPTGAPCVDDQTWADLEFPEIFRRLDATLTSAGCQVLYAELRCPESDDATLAARDRSYRDLLATPALREAVQLLLWPLRDRGGAGISDALFGAQSEAPIRRGWIFAWSLLSLVLLLAIPFAAAAIWGWFAVLVINIAILVHTGWRRGREALAMQHCAELMDVADRLARLHRAWPTQPQLATLAREAPPRAAMRRGLRIFTAHAYLKQVTPPPLSAIFPILDVAFLATLAIHAGAAARFLRTRELLAASFLAVGELDAAIAAASFLRQFPRFCAPAIGPGRPLMFADCLHPLLPDGVANSITIGARSILVTGSNMAGKTTFIKTLACNAIFGQTLGFCLAASASLPRGQVLASIRGRHSVASGKSHYFAEIEAIQRFLRAADSGDNPVIAIDEPFNGTNTAERIAIARAVLEALARRAIVLVTTHDVELQGLLGDAFELYHFQENPDVPGYFDHVLKPGATTEHNAIRLLARLGFPAGIVAAALRYAGEDPSAGTDENVGRT